MNLKTLVVSIAALLIGPLSSDALEGHFKPGNDLRDFAIGMPVSEMNADAYKDRVCADATDIKIGKWADFFRCPRDADGLHAVRFQYDNSQNPLAQISETGEGTKIAGQSVILTLLIDDQSRLAGLEIETDPSVRLFAHRRAYMFAQQVKARYGENGWLCVNKAPEGNEEPIGTSFVKQHCEKTASARRFILDSSLYRDAGQPLRDFVSSTKLLILEPGIKGS